MSRYVVSLGDGDYLREGRPYIVQGEYYPPLSSLKEAKIFESRKKAERACLNRGVVNFHPIVKEIDDNGYLLER